MTDSRSSPAGPPRHTTPNTHGPRTPPTPSSRLRRRLDRGRCQIDRLSDPMHGADPAAGGVDRLQRRPQPPATRQLGVPNGRWFGVSNSPTISSRRLRPRSRATSIARYRTPRCADEHAHSASSAAPSTRWVRPARLSPGPSSIARVGQRAGEPFSLGTPPSADGGGFASPASGGCDRPPTPRPLAPSLDQPSTCAVIMIDTSRFGRLTPSLVTRAPADQPRTPSRTPRSSPRSPPDRRAAP